MTTWLRSVVGVAMALGLVAACDKTPAPAATPVAQEVVPPAPPAPPAQAVVDEPGTPLPEGQVPFTFQGFRSVAFGSPAQALERWHITGEAPAEAGACHFLAESHGSEEAPNVTYMIEGDRFVRIDVEHPEIPAPGGGRIGSTVAELKAAYAAVVDEPHKYVEGGRTLSVADPDGSDARLVFETDAAGVVTRWRIGVPPQIDYVEGCG